MAPYVGTAIHVLAKRLGYIDMWDKPGFKGMTKDISGRRKPSIRNPHISHERLVGLFYEFMDYVEGRLPIPEKFRKPSPGSDAKAPPRGKMGKEAVEALDSLYYS